MADRVATKCDQCGEADVHPKLHLGATTYHHDCLPYDIKQAVQASSPEATKIIAAAEGGTHGDDLLALIQGEPAVATQEG